MEINPRARYTIYGEQYIPQCAELSSVNLLDLLGYIFVNKHCSTHKRAQEKELLEEEVKCMVTRN